MKGLEGSHMKRVFPILAISTFSAMIGAGIIAPLLPDYARDLGASVLWLGIIFAGFSISRALVMPIVGRISDRKGRRKFICAGLLFYALISLGYIEAGSVAQLILVRTLHGFASAMIIPIAQAYVGDLAPKGEEGTWMGYFTATFFTGFGFGPLLGGVLTDLFDGPEAAFYAMGGLSLLAFLLAFFFLPEVRPDEKAKREGPGASILHMRESGIMKGLVGYRLVYAMGRSAFVAFIPLFGSDQLALSAGKIGLLISLHILLMSTSQPIGGRIADAFDRKGLVILGSLVSLSFLALIPIMHSFWQLLALSAFGALGGTLALPAASALTVEEGRRYGMGSAMGAFNMAMSLGMAVGPIIGGLIADLTDIDSVFYFGAGMGLLGTGLFRWFTR